MRSLNKNEKHIEPDVVFSAVLQSDCSGLCFLKLIHLTVFCLHKVQPGTNRCEMAVLLLIDEAYTALALFQVCLSCPHSEHSLALHALLA